MTSTTTESRTTVTSPLDHGRLRRRLARGDTTVGVFVDQDAAHVADVARGLKLSAVQLHGSEQVDAYDAAAPHRLVLPEQRPPR